MTQYVYANDAQLLPEVEESLAPETPLLTPDDVGRDLNPGETVFDMTQENNGNLWKANVTATTTPNDMVVIFDINGAPYPMRREIALLRLGKRYPMNDDQHPGKPVFYRRPPVERPAPTLPCTSKVRPHRRKFWTEEQQRRHFEYKHPAEFRREQESEERVRREREVALLEQQTKMMERMAAPPRGRKGASNDGDD